MHNPSRMQALARQRSQVGLIFAVRPRLKMNGSTAPTKCGTHISPHFKCHGANARAEPGKNITRRFFKNSQRRFQHARSQSAPTGVRSSHTGAAAVGQKYRQAIRNQHRAGYARFRRSAGICGHTIGAVAVQQVHGAAMQLLQKYRMHRLAGCAQRSLPPGTVGLHRCWGIAHVLAQIQTVPRRPTHAACARAACNLYARGPLRGQCVEVSIHSVQHSRGTLRIFSVLVKTLPLSP